jgi:hypothetical protein
MIEARCEITISTTLDITALVSLKICAVNRDRCGRGNRLVVDRRGILALIRLAKAMDLLTMGGVGRLFIAGTSATRPANHAFADIGTRASPRAEISGIASSRTRTPQKRRCYQRRFGAPTRGTAPLRLALAGATRSGSAGVGSLVAIQELGYAPSNWSQLEQRLFLGQARRRT